MRERERGSTLEMIPILVLGVFLVLAVLQTALFMTGRHGAETAAFRASRVEKGRERETAEEVCEWNYPSAYQRVIVERKGRRSSVHLLMDPLIPLPPFRRMTVRAQDPPRLD